MPESHCTKGMSCVSQQELILNHFQDSIALTQLNLCSIEIQIVTEMKSTRLIQTSRYNMHSSMSEALITSTSVLCQETVRDNLVNQFVRKADTL